MFMIAARGVGSAVLGGRCGSACVARAGLVDTGKLISDAQVSEVEYTAFADTRYEITGRLVVRRVLDANTQDPLFPVWRYHPFFTTNTEPTTDADIIHRRHAICETVWSDRLACLSNDVLSWSVLLRQRFELDRYIDACTISGAVGARGSRIP
jgi:hypothetical protein